MADDDDADPDVDPDSDDPDAVTTFNPDDPDNISDDLGPLPQSPPPPAEACRAALKQATALFPNRKRASDGIMGDLSHAARKSDHNQGNAFDLTHDPDNGCDAHELVRRLRLRRDPRVKYIITNREIWNPSISPNFRNYTGSNPHIKHAHVSIRTASRNDTSPWWQPVGDNQDLADVPGLNPEDDVPKPNHVTGEIEFRGGLIQLTFDGGIRVLDGSRNPIPAGTLGLSEPFSVPGLPPEQRQGERGFFHIHRDPDGLGYTLVGTDGAGFNFRST